MIPRRSSRFYLPLVLLFLPTVAHAQDLAAAEALFNKGIADLEAGRYATACPALAESHRLDPRPGTLFALADCQDKSGKIATAAALYADYLRAFESLNEPMKLRHLERSKIAKKQQQVLVAQIPELTLVLPKGAPAGVRIERDGVELSAASLGTGLPVDPGEHVLTIEVPGRPPVTQKITLQKGEKKRVELSLDALKKAQPQATTAAQAPKATPAADGAPKSTAAQPVPEPEPVATRLEAAPRKEGGTGAGRTIGIFTAGGVGIAGLAVGGITGGLALGKKSIVDEHCEDTRCDHEGKLAADSGRTLSIVSTVAFGVGIAGVATATILWLVRPSDKKATQAKQTIQAGVMGIDSRGALIGVRGTF
jgi:hypothetical protein